MIDHDAQLKLQAYLDGELSAREAAKMRDWVARDAEVQALLEELRGMNTVLAGHEADCKLPESREFYWSKIQRQLEREPQPVAAPRESWLGWLRGHLMPLAGTALVLGICGVMTMHSFKGTTRIGEMEIASDDMGSYTFRDPQQKMTMVWLYDRADDSQAAQTVDDTTTVASESE